MNPRSIRTLSTLLFYRTPPPRYLIRPSPPQFRYSPISTRAALPPRPKLPTSDLHHSYLKGSGPGGQKINKTNSAVQLTHLPTGIVVKSQATRSRSQNHKIAREILAEKVEELEKGGESRRARVVERLREKKKRGAKKSRRKYRALAEARREGEAGEVRGGEVVVEGKEEMRGQVADEGETRRQEGERRG